MGFNIRTEQVSSFSRSPKPGPLCAVAMESGCGRERWRNQHAAAELGRNRANPRICPVISARSAPPFFRSSSRLLLSECYRDLQRLHGLFCLHHQSFCSSNQERALSNLRPNTAPECHAGLAIFRSNCARITTPSTDSGSSYLDPPRYGMSVGGY